MLIPHGTKQQFERAASHAAGGLLVCALVGLVGLSGIGGCDRLNRTPAVINGTSHAPEPSPHSDSRIGFIDRAPAAGVRFVPTNGEEAGHRTILETLGVGVAALDYDLNRCLDLVIPGGGWFSEQQVLGRPAALLRNAGGWQFADAASPAGLSDASLYSHGAIAGDYNDDGYPDLLITGYHGLRLYRNQGDGTFQRVTHEARLDQKAWSTSAAWGDLNGDGTLDLYVANYVKWSLEENPACWVEWGAGAQMLQDTCAPERFEAVSDWLFFGDGEGGFDMADAECGLVEGGKGLAVLLSDLDLDGDVDIYVANDATPNFLYRNQGAGRFEEVGALSGTALGDRNAADGSMGVDLGDYNGDGLPDLWVTNYEEQTFALYRNSGDGLFHHASRETGITAVGDRYVGFGTCFIDADLDGDEDLFAANGHVKQTARLGGFHQLPLLFENQAGRHFVNIASQAGPYMRSPHMGRGVAAGDLDNDGDLDLAVAHTNQPIALLSNETPTNANWLIVKLVGVDSQRDAVGSRIVLRAGSQQSRQVKGGTSFLSTSDLRAHFGLGGCDEVDEITVTWPSGRVQALNDILPNRVVWVREERGT